jgi:hypothetical protein
MSNPKAAVDAITACGERVGDIVLHEVTIARIAVLERVGSPFAKETADHANAPVSDVITMLYVMAAESAGRLTAAIRDGTFEEDVAEWADTIKPNQFQPLADAAAKVFGRIDAMMPGGAVEDGGAKKRGAATGR